MFHYFLLVYSHSIGLHSRSDMLERMLPTQKMMLSAGDNVFHERLGNSGSYGDIFPTVYVEFLIRPGFHCCVVCLPRFGIVSVERTDKTKVVREFIVCQKVE